MAYSKSGNSAGLVFALMLSAAGARAQAQVGEETGGAPPPATQPPQAAFWVRVSGDRVNLRSRPDVNSTPVAQLDRDSYLRAVGLDGDWYRVEPPDGVFSLVAAEFVTRESATRGLVKLDTGTLRVRVGSRTLSRDPYSLDVQLTLENGAPVEIIGEQDGWYRIKPPGGVFYYLSREYVERVPDDAAARLSPEALRVRYSDSGATPVAAGEPASQPAGAEMGGVWGQKLAALEPRIKSEGAKGQSADWDALLSELRPLVEQRDEARVAERAASWMTQIQERLEQGAARESAGRLSAESERRRRLRQDRPFDAAGVLSPSFAIEAGRHGLRYKLQNPSSRMVVAYVEFPVEAKLDVPSALSKYVGVWGTRYADERAGVEVIRVVDMTILQDEPGAATQPAGLRR